MSTPLEGTRAARSRIKVWLVGGIALAAVLGGYWYFNRAEVGANPNRGNANANAAPVRVAKVEKRNMAVIERSLGTVLAHTLVQITPRVQGALQKAFFNEGQFVKKGDLLFEIDPRPYEATLAQAKALYRRDQAQLENAVRDRKRYEDLKAQGAISMQQQDTSNTNAAMLEAVVAADKAAIDQAELNLSFTHIYSPIDGKTGPILIQPGNMINATGANGTTLVTIAEVRPVKVSFTLSQADLPRIQERQRTGKIMAVLDVEDAQHHSLSAPVDFIGNAVNNQSGTIELRATFPNEDLSLVPGQLANVTVQLGDINDALVIPREGVNDSPNGPYVYMVAGDIAKQVPITVLFDDGVNAGISGPLPPGADVVIEGQLRVVPDGKVRVMDANGGFGSGGDAAPREGRGKGAGKRGLQ